MQGTLQRIRTSPATARAPSSLIHLTKGLGSVSRFLCRRSAALVFPSTVPNQSIRRSLSSCAAVAAVRHFSPKVSKHPSSTVPGQPEQSEDGSPGQARTPRALSFSLRTKDMELAEESLRQSLQRLAISRGLDEARSWEQVIVSTRHKHGDEGAWMVFLELCQRSRLEVLAWSSAEVLRDHILAAALSSNMRMTTLFEHAQDLCNTYNCEWPDLYLKVLHFYLAEADYENAFLWHLRLAPTFPPTVEIFGSLISSFAVDPEPKLQTILTTMYVFSTYRNLYDHLIPVLFEYGRSKLARAWRKKLLLFQDRPLTSRSRPFLLFLYRYYPQVRLEKDELEIAELDAAAVTSYEENKHSTPGRIESKRLMNDSIVAKLFASHWTSTEFAINLAERLGLREVGPLALQALALREENTQGVLARFTQLEKLNIKISPRTYCRALVSFAKKRDEALLSDLLACDIHPDEFDDIETRQLLMAAAVRRRDWKLERLLQGIEGAVGDSAQSRELNKLLSDNLRRPGLGKARIILDRMESLDVDLAPKNAALLLSRVHEPIGFHPEKKLQYKFGLGQDPRLDRAIDVTRRIALQDIAIPVVLWQKLLYNLGRLGRYDELEELSLHIIQLYSPPSGLIRVHKLDVPETPRASNEESPRPKREAEKEHCFGEHEKATDNKPIEDFLFNFFHDGNRSENSFFDDMEGVEAAARQEERGSLSISKAGDSKPEDKAGSRQEKKSKRNGNGKSNTKEFIPVDLPFSHRRHPVQRIFDPRLQRAIVRWGFDKTIASDPTIAAVLEVKQTTASEFDVASGVRLLATLRDNGVLVDKQVVRSALISRIALAKVPGRKRSRARDEAQLSPQIIKRFVNQAWGEEDLLPPLPELLRLLEDQKPKLWSRYPKLFAKSFDPDHELEEDDKGGKPENMPNLRGR